MVQRSKPPSAAALLPLSLFLLATPSVPTLARAAESKELTLADLVRLALRQSAIAKDGAHEVDIARARVKQARSGYFPSIGIKAGSLIMEESQKFSIPPGGIGFDLSQMGLPAFGDFDPSKPVTNTKTLEVPITDQWINFGLITLTQPLYTGGMIRGYNRMARGGLGVARQAHRLKRQEVIHTVVRRFNDVLLTEKMLEIGERTLTKLLVVLDFTGIGIAARAGIRTAPDR
jgi:outer membrane protein TolC